jgi:predicted transcriptional regulator
MRVNARLDEATHEQLEYLTQATGKSVSLVLRESVAHYYVQVKQQQRPPSRFLALAGTGSSGLGDLSTNVKQYVAEALAQKYPQHMGTPPPPKKRKARTA